MVAALVEEEPLHISGHLEGAKSTLFRKFFRKIKNRADLLLQICTGVFYLYCAYIVAIRIKQVTFKMVSIFACKKLEIILVNTTLINGFTESWLSIPAILAPSTVGN